MQSGKPGNVIKSSLLRVGVREKYQRAIKSGNGEKNLRLIANIMNKSTFPDKRTLQGHE